MKVIYSSDIKEPILSILKERISKIEHAFPSWCHELVVKYKDREFEENESDYHAVIETVYIYRYATLTLYPRFISDVGWYETLVHELHHSLFSPYTLATKRIVETFVSDEKVKDYIYAELSGLEEQLVEDSAYCVGRLLENKA